MRNVSDQDVIREFLLESNESLNRLDSEMVELEQRPGDKALLASIFRTFHTIKGSCGFLGLSLLEGIAHLAENLLCQVRSGEKLLESSLVGIILETVDAVRRILLMIESAGTEGPDEYAELRGRLKAAHARTDAQVADTPGGEISAVELEKTCTTAETAIRVDVTLLDKLMNLVGELVLARNQVLQFSAREEEGGALNATSQRLNLITTELQENVMKTRMQPIGVVWSKLPRLVRDIGQACGKVLHLKLDGSGTELDKTIIEAIKDPLTHLVRNSCDHGIEKPEERVRLRKPRHGTVRLKAYHEGGQVNIEISDDGAGIDVAAVKQKAVERGLIRSEQAERMGEREALHLMFMAGLSTAKTVTNVSGRGVGMDVVRSNVEKIGGTVDVSTVPGQGTVIKLKIPLTLAIIPGLVVSNRKERFLIPQASLLELIRIEGDTAGHIEHVNGTPVYRRRGRLLPVAFLHQVLGLQPSPHNEATNIVVLQAEDRQFGLVVDSIQDTQEIVVKPLGKQLKGLSVFSGATIMGDGRVALILDVLGIGQRSGVLAEQTTQRRAEVQRTAGAGTEHQRLLLFRNGSFRRLAVPLSLVARLEEFPREHLEQAGGHYVVQYRGSLLKVVSLSSILEPAGADTAAALDPVPAIVFANGDRSLGVLVDEILDIVQDDVTVRQAGQRSGLLGSAVVGKQVTDLLDVRAVIQAAAPEWFDPETDRGGALVLVAEPSPFIRGLVRTELEMRGYRVCEATSADEALNRLAGSAVNAVLASVELPHAGGLALGAAMRQQASLAHIPILDLTYDQDRIALLKSLAGLATAVAGQPAAVEVHES